MRFATNEFYHIFNRGVDNKIIFPKKSDYSRFLKGLLFFNSTYPIELRHFKNEKNLDITEIVSPEKLVDIISYCLMKDHVHLLIKVTTPESASEFIRKLFIGYTMYFNTKYERKGVIFQGRSKSKHIDDWIYMEHVLRYIHLNPADYLNISWRKHGIKNTKEIKNHILNYPWSSINELFEEKENTIISQRAAREFLPNKREFINSMLDWSSKDFEKTKDFF
ncbi:transposase [Patescibacteria group bacterium]